MATSISPPQTSVARDYQYYVCYYYIDGYGVFYRVV